MTGNTKALHQFVAFLFFVGLSKSANNDYTVEIPAGSRECFFEVLKKDTEVELEYQVLDGGDLKLDVTLHSPLGTLVFTDFKKTDNTHKFKTYETGEYQLCFDNGVSSYYEKVVFFEIIVDGVKDDGSDDEDFFGRIANQETPKNVQEYDSKVNDFKFRLERIRNRIEHIGHLQTNHRSVESRDRHYAERNFEKVNFWSMVNLAVMITVLVVQVFMIRSLFDEKSVLNRQLNNISTLITRN